MAGTRESVPPIVVELPARPRYLPAAGAVCGGVVLALLALDLEAAVRLGLLAATGALAVAVRRAAARLAAPARLEWTPSGDWRDGDEPLRLGPSTLVLPGLVVLALRGNRRRRYWIARGDVDPVTFRRLKMRLRRVPDVQGGTPGRRHPLLESRDADV
jgi:hypothetical protein